ncbi:hypothetical protein GCM10023079_14070 [Streptomyces chitinivorans]
MVDVSGGQPGADESGRHRMDHVRRACDQDAPARERHADTLTPWPTGTIPPAQQQRNRRGAL